MEIWDILVMVVAAGPAFATYYLTALGHGFFEKSGILNLAIDGVFTLGVATAFTATAFTQSTGIGIISAVLIAMAFGALITYLTTKFPISHGAVGLSVMFVGYGLAALIGKPAQMSYIGKVPWLPSDLQAGATYIVVAIALGLIIYYVLMNTKLGASIRAAGENPHAAATLGVNVLKTRLIASLIGYGLIGLGSSLFVLTYTQTWMEGSGMGEGWIAFAISLSAGRHPLVTIATAGIFAGLLKYRYTIQGYFGISPHISNMIPYIAALAAMVIFMVTPLHTKLAPPKSLGKIYFKEERTV